MADDPDELGRAYEASLAPARRRAEGIHYTPPDVADGLVALALDGLDGAPRVCDPACGGGAFLLAAGRALAARGLEPRRIATELLWGIDSDPGAVRVTHAAIEAWAGVGPGDHVVVGDGLLASERWPGRFDVVVGNPPFQNQLERATLRSVPVPPALAAVVRAYTDTAWLFLVAALDLVRATGGTVVLVQPQSLLAARDAQAVRAEIAARASVNGMWSCADAGFGAAVRVCAPVVHVGAEPAARARRWSGRDFVEDEARRLARPAGSWAVLRSGGDPPPAVRIDSDGPTLATLATATAGFRRQFYGVAPFVIDERDGDDSVLPKLITVGLIDVGRIAWGERSTRLAGRTLLTPRVDLASLATVAPDVAQWFVDRLCPKVLVATQTKVIEAVVDPDGRWLPSTPVISVHAPVDVLWLVGAVLLAPPVTAWALDTYGGTALAHDAVKLAASQVLEIPLPADHDTWREGARLLESGAPVTEVGHVMNDAYGAGDDVLAWWSARLAPAPDRV
jgi:predicted RNA methylase